MATTSNGNLERGEYKNVALEEEDVVEMKKQLATGSAKDVQQTVSSLAPIACYCAASILMTVVNKYVVSGRNFSMNFLLLCIQSSVCVACVMTVKKLGIISIRPFDLQDAKAWFPISFLLVTVIYTGSKSLVRLLLLSLTDVIYDYSFSMQTCGLRCFSNF